ncbi:MAG: ABC transporter ATP-binding protein [Bacteroidales bacterium]|nr:ABC transporter ATP-binding protein [Bacteroidales bacterium]
MSLIVHQLTKSYSTPSGPLPILRDVELSLAAGEAAAITGPSGSGKSTLLHILGTLDRPTSGTVRHNETDPFVLPEADLAAFRNQRIGFVFQDHHLLPQCTVLENVLIPTLVHPHLRPDDRNAYAQKLLERVGLAQRLNHRPAELSGGERQRVAVARALICQPAVLLADEPTGNLDRNTAHAVMDLILELRQDLQMILVVVTHSLEIAEKFPRQMEMRDGVLHPVA